MPVAIWGTKVGMTRVFEGDKATSITVVQVMPNEVLEVKTKDHHGYAALKVAVGQAKRKVAKPLAGEFKKADVAPRRFMREIPMIEGVVVGGKVTVERLTKGAVIDVIGHTKGRGFAGVIRRHNFKGHKQTHGTQQHNHPGSIGCRMDPGRVHKGKRMAGHYGNEQVTIKNLSIFDIDPEQHLVLIRGAIPGPNGGLVNIRQK